MRSACARSARATSTVTGNLKFDVDARCRRSSRADAPGASASAGPVLLLASTREGEEALLLERARTCDERAC